MATNRMCWWEIGAKDTASLSKFYSDAFGWEVKVDNSMGGYTMFGSGDGKDGGIGGGMFDCSDECPPYLTLYVQVEDCDAAVAKVKELGADVIKEPFSLPGVGRIAMFNDPQGHMLGIIQFEQPE